MDGYVLYGAGEHGKVVADALLEAGETVIGFVDDRQPEGEALGIPYLGNWEGCSDRFEDYHWHVSIGNNVVRERICTKIEERLGKPISTISHPKASLSRFAIIDSGCFFAAFSVVGPDARIGRGCIVNHGATVDHDDVLGNYVHICPGANLGGGVIVCDNTVVGIGSSVIHGVSIGENVTVGGGSVVIRNLDPDQTVAGNPASSIKK